MRALLVVTLDPVLWVAFTLFAGAAVGVLAKIALSRTAQREGLDEAAAAEAEAIKREIQETREALGDEVELLADVIPRTSDQVRASIERDPSRLNVASLKPYMAVAITVICGGVSVFFLLKNGASEDDHKAAWTMLSGIVGFWLGVGSS